MSVTHLFVSALPDGADATLVRPSNWNEAHVVSIDNADVAAGAGIVESKLSLNFPTHAAVTIGTANGLSLVAQALSLGLASSGVTGALSGTDWDTFNGKQSALTFPLASTLGGTGVNNAGTLTNASNTTITGGGTIALGGFTLTVPATGTAALLATANVFTTQQMVDGSSDQIQLRVQANATQTTSLHTWENSSGAVVAGIDERGVPYCDLAIHVTNTFFGSDSGRTAATGLSNTGIGFATLKALTGGTDNTLVGYNAGIAIVGGSNNTGIGSQALNKVASGNRNTAIGHQALFNCTGSGNFAFGYQSGFSLTSGGTNIFMGPFAGYRHTTQSNIFVVDAQGAARASLAEEQQNAYMYGSVAAPGYLQLNMPTTTNNAVLDTLKLQAYVSTASTGSANGFGVGLPFYAETATDATYQQQGLISTSWIDATNASRKAKMSLSAYDTAARLGIEIEASGTAVKLGFFGVAPVVRPTALTTQLTTITFTAPTPDYAIQDLVDSSGGAAFGFATKDEGNTVLSVIANLQTRVGELETKLQALGLLT